MGSIRLAAAAASLILSGCVTTDFSGPPLPKSPIVFPTEAVPVPTNTPPRPQLQRTVLYRPSQGSGPFPAVVMLHTCGGVGAHIIDWARRLTSDGYVALVVASNGARNVADNCQGAYSLISLESVGGDATAALAHLLSHPLVRNDALAVIGFSFGSMAAVRLASASYQKRAIEGVDGLRAIAFFYGSCGVDSPDATARRTSDNVPSDVVTPTMLFLGDEDNETPASFCVARAKAVKASGRPIDYRLYPKTTHSFDDPFNGIQGRTIYHGARGPFTYRYNPEATKDTWRETKALFDRELKGVK